MYEDVYFKKIIIPNYEEIVKSSLEFVRNDSKIYDRKLSSYYIVDLKKFTNQCPLLMPSFEKIGLKPYLVSIFVMYKNEHGPNHIDLFPPNAKVLIPLLNTKGTKTNFYGKCKMIRVTNPISGIKSYRPVSTENMSLNATIEVIDPIIIRTSVPHNIEMVEENFPRITMQVETDPDPIKFLSPLPEYDENCRVEIVN